MNKEDLAEIIGIMLGDGNLYISTRHNAYQIRVAGNSVSDKEYLINFVKPLFEKTFGVPIHIKHVPKKHTLYVCCNSKEVCLILIRHGLTPGNKKKNNVSIPKWIFGDIKYMRACLRGLIDTDGSLYPKTRKHPCASIWFSSAIPNIRRDFIFILKELEYNPSKWVYREDSTPQTCLGKSTEVIRYYKEIGFSNIKHKSKFEKFYRAPVV